MHPNSVIHTVKHGVSVIGGDAEVDWYACDVLTSDKLNAVGSSGVNGTNTGNARSERTSGIDRSLDYSDAYKHFDNLIWQIPLWATGVFSVFLALLGLLFGLKADSGVVDVTKLVLNTSTVRIGLESTIGIIAIFFCFIIGMFSYTLFRFRCHQAFLKNWCVSQSSPFSPQVILHLMVNFEFFIVFMFSMFFFITGKLLILALVVGVILILLITLAIELRVRNESTDSNSKVGSRQVRS